MRGPGVIAGLLAICGAVVLSGPAHADQYDFISQLDNSGVSYQSMIDMIDTGKQLCHDLRNGVAPPAVLGKLQRTGFAPAESAIILMSAVNNMCVWTLRRGLFAGHGATGMPARCKGVAPSHIRFIPDRVFVVIGSPCKGTVVSRAVGGPPHLPAVK